MQVWLGNRRVGEANLSPRPGQSQITVHLMEDFPMTRAISMNDPVPQPRAMILRLAKMQFRIDHFEMDRARNPETVVAEHFRRYGLSRADECERFEDFARNAMVYVFKVIKVTKDQLEEIFDFDWFEPSDGGEPDRDYFDRRREEMMSGNYGL